MIVRVILPLPLDGTYSYEVPADLQPKARPGCRVVVEFGQIRRTGVIAEVASDPDYPREASGLKPVLEVLDNVPSLSEEVLRLTRWMADYYVCGWGEVVRMAIPPGIDRLQKTYVRRTETPAGAWEGHPNGGPLLRHLEAHATTTLSGLRAKGIDASANLLRRLESNGLVTLETTLEEARVKIRYEKHLRFAAAFRAAGAEKDLAEQLRGIKQKAVVRALAAANREGCAEPRLSDVLKRADAAAATARSLAEKGIVEVFPKEVTRVPSVFDVPARRTRPHVLNAAQSNALESIAAAVDAREYRTLLLHGVTGSGKTEVYMAALSRVLARGQSGIVLVPEIALTPQTVRRFRERFGDRIAVLHSGMSDGERFDAWRHLRSGRYSVAIGPRSAVLAPLSDIGLIVVDEEHEPTYKQDDPAPRYHARDVAVLRARMNGAVCVLGSATPSLESLRNARRGKYRLLEMKERVPVPGLAAAPLPEIRIVDLTLERRRKRLDGALSMPLREAIEERLSEREQVILLHNRRGYSPIVECLDCGSVPRCMDCAVTMTYHKPHDRLRCHYCGHTWPLPDVCPECGSPDLSKEGAGTQRVEEELVSVFPDATVVRMDLDTTGRRNAHHEILDRFGRGDAEILIGTQMVAKGLDFPRVTLVGVVNADVGMTLPDFRAEERVFQLLMQVAGRAGRAELRGEVVIQTRQPKHPVFRHILAHDYGSFTAAILEERRALGYPPFGRLVGVEFRGPRERAVEEIARRWSDRIRRELPPAIQILGPAPAFVGRVKRQYRYHVVLKAPKGFTQMQEHLRAQAQSFRRPPRGYHVSVNVDVIGLY